MSGLVIAAKIEASSNIKDIMNEVVDGDMTTLATTASPCEPDPDAIKMFVGQIPRHWNETDCRRLFESYGPVYSCNILRDKSTQSSKGCCFVTYFHRKNAIEAQGALHNIKIIDGMHHPVQMKPADTENRNERKLFIGQLSKKHNEEDLRALFSKYGQIEDCSVLRDQDGKSRGCAFVTFNNRSCAVIATKEMHHSQTMEGCAAPLVVKFADTQKDKDVKQKAAILAGNNSGSPKASSILGNLNPALIGGGAQNIQAVASILSLLGGQQNAAVNQQQNVLGLLGSVLSALGKLTENGGEEKGAAPSSSSSAAASGVVSSNEAPAVVGTSVAGAGQLAHLLPAAVAQTPTQLDALTQAHIAQIAQHNQILALQGYAVQQQIPAVSQAGFFTTHLHHQQQHHGGTPDTDSGGSSSGCSVDERQLETVRLWQAHQQLGLVMPVAPYSIGAYGLAGGLAGAKTTSPVAATLPHTSTIALTPYGGAGGGGALDPFQAAAIQQQYAMLANLQATTSNTTSGTGSAVVGNGDVKGPDGANLFIYHLPQDFGDTDLLNTFAPFGTVLSAKVFIDKVTNLSKCFGFVSFDNPTSAANAIQAMNGFQIGSKRLKVQLKVDRGNPYNR